MTIAPALRYHDAPAAITFLTQAFGLRVLARYDGPDGTVAHAQLGIDGGAVMLSSRGPVVTTNPWTTVNQGLYVHVHDADAHHRRAAGAGADIVMPLRDTEYGSREYSARDSEGHFWAFGTYPTGATGARTMLFPGLCYANAKSAARFLEDAFGFEHRMELLAEDGRLTHGELWFGSGAVIVSQDLRGEGMWGHTHGNFISVSNIDAHHAAALVGGARVLQAPHETSTGMRTYYAADPEGFLWGFSTGWPAA